MKTRFLATLLSLSLVSWAAAEETLLGAEDSLAPAAPDPGQLEILMAPIALYPDALVALILPAATRPSEIVLASRFLSGGGKEEDIDAQVWDDSVKALARFPEVVDFMDENLEWTQDVGDAFVAHPVEVMGAIQSLRARAARNGTLASTPQQQVVFEDDDTIRIIPAEPTVIYVPYYEPSILYPTYSYSYFPSSLVWFGVGYTVGWWMSYDCDWRYRTVWVHHHHSRSSWPRDYDWRRRYKRDADYCIGGSDWNRWRPSGDYRRSRPRGDYNYARTTVRTTPSRLDGGSGRFDSSTTWTDADRRRTDGARTWSDRSRTRTDGDRDRTRTDGDRNRLETRRDGSRTGSGEDRTVRRPDTLRSPTRIDRNEANRTVDNRRGDRDSSRPSGSLVPYTGSNPTPSVTTPRRETPNPVVNRRNEAPVRRVPDTVDRRPTSIDRRPDVARTPPPRRETARPVSPPPAPAVRSTPPPARTINSGADIRRPQPSVSAPARQPSVSAPARQPSYSAPRGESTRSTPQAASSIRHREVDTNQN